MAIVTANKTKPPVHAESVRAGIRLAFASVSNTMPAPEVVERILAQGKAHLEPHEFPLELVTQQTQMRRDIRRAYAIKALEVLLARATDGFQGENKDEEMVDRAWNIAAQMERHDNSGLMMDVLTERGEKH